MPGWPPRLRDQNYFKDDATENIFKQKEIVPNKASFFIETSHTYSPLPTITHYFLSSWAWLSFEKLCVQMHSQCCLQNSSHHWSWRKTFMLVAILIDRREPFQQIFSSTDTLKFGLQVKSGLDWPKGFQ